MRALLRRTWMLLGLPQRESRLKVLTACRKGASKRLLGSAVLPHRRLHVALCTHYARTRRELHSRGQSQYRKGERLIQNKGVGSWRMAVLLRSTHPFPRLSRAVPPNSSSSLPTPGPSHLLTRLTQPEVLNGIAVTWPSNSALHMLPLSL